MPRQARQVSQRGIYHLIVRGINREVIFHDDEDRQRYLETLARITAALVVYHHPSQVVYYGE